jgi:hypothetical protein
MGSECNNGRQEQQGCIEANENDTVKKVTKANTINKRCVCDYETERSPVEAYNVVNIRKGLNKGVE